MSEAGRVFSARVTVQPGQPQDAKARWIRAKKLELGFRDLLNDLEPTADNGLTLHFREVATLLKGRTKTPDAIQDDVAVILRCWQEDDTITVRVLGDELFILTFRQTCRELHAASQQRLQAAERILRHLLRPLKDRGNDLTIEISRAELQAVSTGTGPEAAPREAASTVSAALFTLQITRVLSAQSGADLFPSATPGPPPSPESLPAGPVGSPEAAKAEAELSDAQRAIVEDESGGNIMILAGPGSGKTRTLVHRAAWLVRIRKVSPESVLIVAFNRATVLEIRHRLKHLIGREARRVHVQTYHGLALRIAGRSLAVTPETRKGRDFEAVMTNVVREANRILEGLRGRARDEMTGGLIGRLLHILVDEYQDVNAEQYRMVTLLARKDEPDAAGKIQLLAVGDDDQNIYTWNGADVRFLRQFAGDYQAVIRHLLTNYRSSPDLVQHTSRFIAGHPGRLKRDAAMVSFRADHPPGPRDRISLVSASSPDEALRNALAEVRWLQDHGFLLPEIAVLARGNEDVLMLRQRAEEGGLATTILRKPPVTVLRLREVQRFLSRLREAARQEPPPEMVAAVIQNLRAGFGSPDNPWEMLIDAVVEQYFEETAHPLVNDCLHFFMDSIREFRQGETRREGCLALATMHAAKGLEFPAVIVLLDGTKPTDEETRLVYVAMTRARESLSMISSSPGTGLPAKIAALSEWRPFEAGPPTAEIGEGKRAGGVGPGLRRGPGRPGKVRQRRVFEFGPADVYLSWPASHAGRQIMDTIARLEVGTKAELVRTGDEYRILFEGVPVVIASKAGSRRLKEFTGMTPVDVTCYAVLTRSKQEESPEFQRFIRHEEWEYPLFQVTFSRDEAPH